MFSYGHCRHGKILFYSYGFPFLTLDLKIPYLNLKNKKMTKKGFSGRN